MYSNYISWNIWHGCHKKSEGCMNCYMFIGDKEYGLNPEEIRLVKSAHNLPLKRDSSGAYKYKSGTVFSVCLTSDFFLEEADVWRQNAWDIMAQRDDCMFVIITKRPERIKECLPKAQSLQNIVFSCTVENQKRANERLPEFIKLDVPNKAITVAPLLERVDLGVYLASKQIKVVTVGGENGENARESDFEWVQYIQNKCKKYEVDFSYFSTGKLLRKEGIQYTLNDKQCYQQAKKANIELRFRHNLVVPNPKQLSIVNFVGGAF